VKQCLLGEGMMEILKKCVFNRLCVYNGCPFFFLFFGLSLVFF
jgi:hypothetical protein